MNCPGTAPGLSGFGFKIGLSLAFAGQGMVFGLGYNNALSAGEAPEPFSPLYWLLHGGLLLSAVAVCLLLGRPLLIHTIAAIRQRRISVEALFVLSAFGALAGSLISTFRGSGSVYYEVVSIVLCVYAIGKQIGVIQKGRVAEAINSFRHTFDVALREERDGQRRRIAVAEVHSGDRILVHPGDPISVDGRIVAGSGYVRETAITGEPAPVRRLVGDYLQAGTWSLDGNFVLEASGSRIRAIDGILRVLEAGSQRVSDLQRSADRIMLVFVPFVSLFSVATFAGWALFSDNSIWDALFNAMAVLLVACPCALGLALPTGLWAGLYHLAQRGIAGRNGHLLDALAGSSTFVFDKTGTLGEFELGAQLDHLEPDAHGREWLLAAIASLAAESRHPVSQTLCGLSQTRLPVQSLQVHPGLGLSARVDGAQIVFGEWQLLLESVLQADEEVPPGAPAGGKHIHVSVDGRYAGCLILAERLRTDAEATLAELTRFGIRCRILSGDPTPARDAIGGIPIQGGLTAEAKAEHIRAWERAGERILFIGDGVNDLPAMQASDASLAIDLGSELATEFADGVLLGGRVASLPTAVRHARRLRASLQGNLRFALAYNLIGMGLAAAGLLHPVVAALLMTVSSALVSYRSLRAAGLQG